MAGEAKIAPSHLARLAVVYVRQSTLLQVRDHAESTARQYALTDRAVTLGWAPGNVVVIDTDLGVSGRFSGLREGFKEVVARVCLGEVGAVLGLEVSRLARSSAEFARLLEYARLTDALLIDGDGVYDLADFNDRLLLGLKGTMSEAELRLLSGRLHGARRAAAERGDLRLTLPIGLVYDLDDRIVPDPDEQVRTAIADLFTTFEQAGSAFGLVRAFADRTFPARAVDGRVRFGRLTHSRALEILKNPVYAGAYAFGRSYKTAIVQPDGTVVTATRARARSDWPVLIVGHHDGYITWQQYLDIEARLASNRTNAGARPVREGAPLCQGIIYCGACGYPMSTRYRHADGTADYVCNRARCDAIDTAACHSIAATAVDAVVQRALLAALTPEQIALAADVAAQVHQRHTRSHRAAELALERARYEAHRAERAFDQVDPGNRLVARSLEARWETKLAALAEAESALADLNAARPPLPEPEQLRALAADLPRLWKASSTGARDRKRLLRTLIADVTIREVDHAQIHVGIRWHTGQADEHVADRRTNRTPYSTVERIKSLVADHDDARIADILNAEGLSTGKHRPFTTQAVLHVRKRHRIDTTRTTPTADGEITVMQAADILQVHESAIFHWLHSGEMRAHQLRNKRWCIPWNPDIEAHWLTRAATSRHVKRTNPKNKTKEAV